MWNSIEHFLVMMAVNILQHAIKNPKSAAVEGHVIADIAQVATEADMQVNGTIWTSTSAPAPAAA